MMVHSFVLLLSFVLASSAQNVNYCCQNDQRASGAECTLGGCQWATTNLQQFYSVDDCTQCVTDQFRNNSGMPTFKTSCTYCAAGGQMCVQNDAIGDSLGCAQSDASRQLYSFDVTNLTSGQLLDRPFCCYYRAPNATGGYSVANDTGRCPYSVQTGQILVAFVEHYFAFDCPARPPCESACNEHGFCAVSQCVCDRDYYGDACDSLCNDSNCVIGECFNDASRTAHDDWSAFFDEPLAVFGEVVRSAKGNGTAPPLPSKACHCDRNVVGAFCDRCAPQYVGEFCETFCAGAPCNGSFMTGNCSNGGCACLPGYALDRTTHDCVCQPKLCTHGTCDANDTCACAGQWRGDGCQECGCLHNGTCSMQGVCECAPGYTGDLCESCLPPFFNLTSNCTVFCLDHTVVNVTVDGNMTAVPDGYCQHNGLCEAASGACNCTKHATGKYCENCEDNYFGASCEQFCDANKTCAGLGACNNATGTCDCFKSGFGGNCTTCKENYYPKGVCTTMCDHVTTCNYHGNCTEAGVCACYNDIIYQLPDCSVKVWVIIVPCVAVVAIFAGFVGYIIWRKKRATDEFGEPLLGGGW